MATKTIQSVDMNLSRGKTYSSTTQLRKIRNFSSVKNIANKPIRFAFKPSASKKDDVGLPVKESEIKPTVESATSIKSNDQRHDTDTAKLQNDKAPAERLWSNLNADTLTHEAGSLAGAITLVGGTTVGAGILALPAVTQPGGFVGSSAAILGCWVYMVSTGLLMAEVNVNTLCSLGTGGVSFNSMAQRTLGDNASKVGTVAYMLKHYLLLVAYIARAGEITSTALNLPPAAGLVLFTLVGGGTIYLTNKSQMDAINGVLCTGVVGAFGLLLAFAAPGIQLENLNQANWSAVPPAIPVVALAFVYHNVVPVITTSLEGDLTKVRQAIVIGTGIPLAMFLAWDAAILGQIPPGSALGDPLSILRETDPLVGPFIQIFSMLAITTSFIGVTLGVTDFIADTMKLPVNNKAPLPFVASLAPPLVFATLFPDVFFNALEVAGVFGVLVLFGLFPSAMAWRARYSDVRGDLPPVEEQLPGGKFSLVAIFGSASFIILSDIASRLSNVI